MTRKDGKLVVGSLGVEFLSNGEVVDSNAKWIKEIDEKVPRLHFENNFSVNYDRLYF